MWCLGWFLRFTTQRFGGVVFPRSRALVSQNLRMTIGQSGTPDPVLDPVVLGRLRSALVHLLPANVRRCSPGRTPHTCAMTPPLNRRVLTDLDPRTDRRIPRRGAAGWRSAVAGWARPRTSPANARPRPRRESPTARYAGTAPAALGAFGVPFSNAARMVGRPPSHVSARTWAASLETRRRRRCASQACTWCCERCISFGCERPRKHCLCGAGPPRRKGREVGRRGVLGQKKIKKKRNIRVENRASFRVSFRSHDVDATASSSRGRPRTYFSSSV